TDRTSGDRLIQRPRHGGDYRRRIKAAAEKGAEGNFTHQTYAGGLAKFVADTLAPVGFAQIFSFSERQIPIGLLAKRAIARDDDVMPGKNLPHGTVDRFWRRDVSEGKVVKQGLGIDIACQAIGC